MNERVKRTQPESERGPDRMGNPGRTPGTAEGGTEDEKRRRDVQEPARTPGSAEGGVRDDGPARH